MGALIKERLELEMMHCVSKRLVLCILVNTFGFTSFNTVNSTASGRSSQRRRALSDIAKGDPVKLELGDGTKLEGVFQEYDGAILELESKSWRGIPEVRSIEASDISEIQVREFNPKATIGASVLILGIITTIIVITIVDPFDFGFAPQNI